MNRPSIRSVLLISIICCSGFANTAAAESLTQAFIDRSLESVLAEDREARLSAYFGKRNELVTINSSAFFDRTQVDLALAEGAVLRISRSSIEEIVTGVWKWKGIVTSPRNPVYPVNSEDLSPQDLPPDELQRLADEFYSVEFILVSRRSDDSDARTERHTGGPTSAQGMAGRNAAEGQAQGRSIPDYSTGFWVSGRVQIPTLASDYRLEPLSKSEGLHIMVEVDPEKRFFLKTHENATESDENRTRREAFEEFRSSLDEPRSGGRK